MEKRRKVKCTCVVVSGVVDPPAPVGRLWNPDCPAHGRRAVFELLKPDAVQTLKLSKLLDWYYSDSDETRMPQLFDDSQPYRTPAKPQEINDCFTRAAWEDLFLARARAGAQPGDCKRFADMALPLYQKGPE